jgi:hypothetical protein
MRLEAAPRGRLRGAIDPHLPCSYHMRNLPYLFRGRLLSVYVTHGAALLKGRLARRLPDDRLIGDVVFCRRVREHQQPQINVAHSERGQVLRGGRLPRLTAVQLAGTAWRPSSGRRCAMASPAWTRHPPAGIRRLAGMTGRSRNSRARRTRAKLDLAVVPGCGACRLVASGSRDGGAWQHSAHPPRWSLRMPGIRYTSALPCPRALFLRTSSGRPAARTRPRLPCQESSATGSVQLRSSPQTTSSSASRSFPKCRCRWKTAASLTRKPALSWSAVST